MFAADQRRDERLLCHLIHTPADETPTVPFTVPDVVVEAAA